MSRAEGFIGEHDFYRRCVNFKHLPFSARVFLLCIKLPQGLIYAMGRRRGLHFQQMSPSLCFCARWHLTQWAHALTPAGICSASLFLQLDPEVTEEQRFIYMHCLGAASPRDGRRRGVGPARSLNGALTSWHGGCRHPASVLWTCCRGPVALASPYPQEVLKYLNPQLMLFSLFPAPISSHLLWSTLSSGSFGGLCCGYIPVLIFPVLCECKKMIQQPSCVQ